LYIIVTQGDGRATPSSFQGSESGTVVKFSGGKLHTSYGLAPNQDPEYTRSYVGPHGCMHYKQFPPTFTCHVIFTYNPPQPTTQSCTIRTAYVVDTASTDPPCKPAAVANVDRSIVNDGDTVTLDGSKSTDSGGGTHLLYHWEQGTGPTVDLSDPTAASTAFTAPKDLSDTTKLSFNLVVTDNLDVNDKAYHGNPASTPASADVTICATKIDPSLNKVQNVPNTQSGSCDYSKIDVRARPVAGMPVGFGYAYHTWIVFTNEENQQYVFDGGPKQSPYYRIVSLRPYDAKPVGSDLLGVWSAGKQYTQAAASNLFGDWYPDARSITILKGKENVNDQVGSCLIIQAIKISNSRYEYAETGPNSNTLVRTLLDNCGLPKPNFGTGIYIPGFDFNLSKYPTAPPPPTVTPGPPKVGSIIVEKGTSKTE
jgi:hypothetical protein